VTATQEYTCKTCDAPGEYVRPAPGDYVSMGSFQHLDGDPGHRFEPKPQCPQCGSFDYVFDQTDPWADITQCGSCGHADRRSLGD